MKHILKLASIALIIVIISMLATSLAFAQDPDNGKVLWEETVKQCQRCHGMAGEGKWAGPLAGHAKSADEWIAQVRTPRNRMPSFSTEQISDAMITDMHAYLTTLTKPDGFTPADAELADDAMEGQKLMVEKKCVACHGVAGPINGFIKRGEVPTVERIVTQLRTPFKNMPSYSESQVSEAEATLIVDFMVSQMPPPELPVSGATQSTTDEGLLVILLLAGSSALALGLYIRRGSVFSRGKNS